MRNSLLDPYEDLPRDVVVTSNDYAAEFAFPPHAHRRGQFAFAARGTISVATPQGRWLVPPRRACWVPAGLAHEMTMRGPVTMLNAFLSAEAADAVALPEHCRVYAVSALLQQLLVAEIASMPTLSLHAPLPTDARLARVCRALLDSPSLAVRLDDVAAEAGMSRRTFTRLFRADTGVGFAEWRQQVCLLVAIERLGQGQAVTRVALDLGYASPSAFSAAFRRVLGCSPSRYAEA